MSRTNRTVVARRRSHFTGESHQLAYQGIVRLAGEGRLVPSAHSVMQEWVESAVLHRLLLGTRVSAATDSQPDPALPIVASCPLAVGLRLLVPADEVRAFGDLLAMRGSPGARRIPFDGVVIDRRSPSKLVLRRADGAMGDGAVTLRCSWKQLHDAVKESPAVWMSSGAVLRFNGRGIGMLTGDDRAVLSALLRRIALFREPGAFHWLLGWHDWLMRGRAGRAPALPHGLSTDLSDEAFGLLPAHFDELGSPGEPALVRSAPLMRARPAVLPGRATEILGRRMRSLRTSCELEVSTVAGELNIPPARISRMESGNVRIPMADLLRLLPLFGVSDPTESSALLDFNAALNDDGRWRGYGDNLDAASASYVAFTAVADCFRAYDVDMVPDVLQTTAYAMAVLRGKFDPLTIRRRTEVRLRQQSLMLSGSGPLTWVVIDHAAIIGGADDDVLREQIEFLLEADESPRVSIQMLMSRTEINAIASFSFSLVIPRGSILPTIANLPTLGGRMLLSEVEEVDPYRETMELICLAAEPPASTRRILKSALRGLRGPGRSTRG